jgi:hypothetical protein
VAAVEFLWRQQHGDTPRLQRVARVTSLSGVGWDEVRRREVPGVYGDVPVRYIGRTEFIENKKAAGPRKDLADLEALGEVDPL